MLQKWFTFGDDTLPAVDPGSGEFREVAEDATASTFAWIRQNNTGCIVFL